MRLDVQSRRRRPCRGRRPLGHDGVVAIGRRGGPEFLDSELARLGHLVGLAASIARRERRRLTAQARSSRKTGISRSVFFWYSPYVGQVSTA